MNTNISQSTQESRNQAPMYDLHEFKSIHQLLETYPGLMSENSLRWVLRYRHENGLNKHVTRLGRTLLIHVPGFTSWLMTHGD